jgi:hypothetical protein
MSGFLEDETRGLLRSFKQRNCLKISNTFLLDDVTAVF